MFVRLPSHSTLTSKTWAKFYTPLPISLSLSHQLFQKTAMDQLPKCGANYVPLTPLTFLTRASNVYSNRASVIYRRVRFTWRQTYERCCRLASALKSLNIGKNDVVSI